MSTVESRISFSANGAGVVLFTKYGELSFSTDEYNHYQNLFKLADNDNLGKLLLGSTQLNMLLIRTDIEWSLIEKAIKVVKQNGDIEPPGLLYNQWLMLCKIIACYQETKKVPSEKMFKQLHSKGKHSSLADFSLAKATKGFIGGQFYKDYKVEIVGWHVYGEEYQSQHVKFKISTLSQIVNLSEAKTNITQEMTSVERRYSDFESFAAILHRNYKGLVIPPLPPKNWSVFAASDTAHINQRQQEFQMFLHDLVTHPILRYCYELKAFLESSSPGYKSFVELYSHFVDGRSIYQSADAAASSSSSQIQNVTKMFNEGVMAVSGATNVVTQTKAFGYISSLWGIVSKSVFRSSTDTHVESSEDITVFDRTAVLLSTTIKIGEKVENLVTLDTNVNAELAKLASYFKNISEFEQMPDLVRTYQITHTGLSDLCFEQTQKLQQLFLFAQTPIVYLGRYMQSFQSSSVQRTATISALCAAQRKEAECKKSVDMLLTATSSSGLNQQPVASTSPSSTTFNEELLNQAKLDLAAAEDASESAKEVEIVVSNRLKGECKHLECIEKTQLMTHLVKFAKLRAEACQSNLAHWLALKDSLGSHKSNVSLQHQE